MCGPLGSLLDPPFEKSDFFGFERLLGSWWRHHLIGITRHHAANEFTLAGLSRNNYRFFGSIFEVEPQLGFTMLLVRPVTMKTLVGQDWPDVAVEADRLGRCAGTDEQACCDQKNAEVYEA